MLELHISAICAEVSENCTLAEALYDNSTANWAEMSHCDTSKQVSESHTLHCVEFTPAVALTEIDSWCHRAQLPENDSLRPTALLRHSEMAKSSS